MQCSPIPNDFSPPKSFTGKSSRHVASPLSCGCGPTCADPPPVGLQGHRPRTEPAKAWAAGVTAGVCEHPNTILQLTGSKQQSGTRHRNIYTVPREAACQRNTSSCRWQLFNPRLPQSHLRFPRGRRRCDILVPGHYSNDRYC